jgi:uncharacterized protein (DUF885 family)
MALSVLVACSENEARPKRAAPAVESAPRADGGPMTDEAERRFDTFSQSFLAAYFERNPTAATQAGDHRHDTRWPDMSEDGEAKDRRFIDETLKALHTIAVDGLGRQSRIDHALIEKQLLFWRFSLDELREAAWNPMAYTGLVGDGLDPLVTREFAPIEERMASLGARLEGIERLVSVAKARLKDPPAVYTETAIQQNKGLIELCESDLQSSFARVPAKKAELEAKAKRAAAALRDFQAFLENDLARRSGGSFRLGRARFEKKLRFELDDQVDIDAIANDARALVKSTRREMVETAKALWPELFPGQKLPGAASEADESALLQKVLAKVAEDRPTNESILDESKRLLDDATAFVRKHDLVRIPDEPCKVIEMPEYRRGVSVAYCDASGPLEKKQETFFAISPTPKDWSDKRVESFYREYNRSMLAELTVHEAMPGHFLQLMHNNRFPSKLRAVFSSGSFVEGWAVYSEWLMGKHGFLGLRVALMRQKMVLRLSVNAILDHGVHAGDLDEKGALELMMKDAFQEEGEAVGKWKRARLSSAQLTTYYYGFTEMMKIRKAVEGQPGFSERAYHDKLLSFGSPSMRHIRDLMLHPR